MMSTEDIHPVDCEKLGSAIDSLENYVTILTVMKTLPDSIHVSTLREGLPQIVSDLKALLPEEYK
jgi:uncharacterized protein YidB (DUF937 family)